MRPFPLFVNLIRYEYFDDEILLTSLSQTFQTCWH